MADYKLAYPETAAVEGGWSDHKSDTGGETWKGIARNKNPNWSGWKIIDDLKRTTGFPSIMYRHDELNRLVFEFYKKEYWDKLRLDQVNDQQIANKLYDIAVNCGVGFAGKALQRILNVANQNGRYYKDLPLTGNVRELTLNAVNSHPRPSVILKGLNVLQGAHYITITENREANEAFLNGWFMNRIVSVINENKFDNIA